MVERLRAEGVARPARPRRVRRGAAPSLRRRRAGDAGLRGHQPADRPRPDDLEALGRRAACSSCCSAAQARRRAGDLGAVLEIGTGCGYQAALLAQLGKRVISVERLKPLHDKARELLAPLRDSRASPRLRRRHARPSAGRALRQHHRRGGRRRDPAGLARPARRRRPAGLAGRSSGARARCWSSSTGTPIGYDPQRSRGGEVRPLKIRAVRYDEARTFAIHARDRGPGATPRRCMLVASPAPALAARRLRATPNRAPVEDRSPTPRATVAAASPAQSPASAAARRAGQAAGRRRQQRQAPASTPSSPATR